MQELISEYQKSKKEIKARLEHFSRIPKEDYFYELCFCILTPQSNAKQCDKAVQDLIKRKYKEKKKAMDEIKDNQELREWLVKNVKGISYKESAHFLRNVGYRNLAILDRHILKNLVKYGGIKELPKTLTKKKYFEIENQFKEFSKKVNIPIDELDLLFWSMEAGEIFK